MDYHHLNFGDSSFDGVYTIETFVHATDPRQVLDGFFRVLKPGGSLSLYEYDHTDPSTAPRHLRISMGQVNKYAAMPTNVHEGVLLHMLEEVGFQDILIEDLSANIKPMLRLFFVLAITPYLFIKLFGLEPWFVNTVAGVGAYLGNRRGLWRYIAVTARKPPSASDSSVPLGKKAQ
jgi:sterol 24-C-methyltransferase